jgi:hypothetical protein
MPVNAKRLLGLDAERSWIVVTELNGFLWPGPDVRIPAGRSSPVIDAIPDWLFHQVRDAVLAHSEAGRLGVTTRTE